STIYHHHHFYKFKKRRKEIVLIIVDKVHFVLDYSSFLCCSRIIIRIFQKNKDVNVKEKEEGKQSAKERDNQGHFHRIGKRTFQDLQLQADSF
ncbi:hypothetical protein, partial [Allomuricauda sp. MMSF_3336]|uniref:hypothetical protein n=1 Tax=Allomuricauda sp. MMSF_3336 TaxID=3046704 RepID=UPI00273DDA67